MKAAVWTDYGKMEIQEVPQPVIKDNEVLLKVRAAGVCKTDLHVYTGQFAYGKPPHILGHEICGEVVEIGAAVKGIMLGQRVLVETSIGCGACDACKRGDRHLCVTREEIGTAPHTGGYAQYVKAPAQNVVPLLDAVTDEEAAIFESAVCPSGGLMRIGVPMGETVVVYGVGPAGLSFAQVAKALGAGKVIVVARNKQRLEKALHFGADAIVCSAEESVVERIAELTDGNGAGLVCDTTGAPCIIEEAMEVAAHGGRVILYGLPAETAELPFPVKTIIMKQLAVHGVENNPYVWKPLMHLVASGRVNLKDMVTHTFPLDRIQEAFALLENPKEDPIKIVVYPWNETTMDGREDQ